MLRTIRHLGISYQIEDEGFELFWDTIASGNWEPETFEALQRCLRPTDTMLDIGCWYGPLALFAAQLCQTVVAVDPDPAAFASMKRNVALNPTFGQRIVGVQAAIAAASGTRQLHARNFWGDSASSLLHRSLDTAETETVAALSLDELLQKSGTSKVDFLKIDIEGGEFEVLTALSDFLKRMEYPTLLIAFHPSYLAENYLQQWLPWRFGAKVLLKLAKWGGWMWFRSRVQHQTEKIFENLAPHYDVYFSNGEKSTFSNHLAWLQNENLLLVRK